MGWAAGIRFSAEARISLFHGVSTGSQAHISSIPIGALGSFLVVKWLEREADNSFSSSADVWNGGAVPQLLLRPHCVMFA
jgi:hypothetical protein